MFCENVARVSPNIEAVIVTSGARLAGSYSRKGFLLPAEERMASILIQAEIMMSIPMRNEDYFGRVNYVMIDHSGVHNFLFPLRGIGVLGVGIVPPYDRDALVAKISALLDAAAVLSCDVNSEERSEESV